MHERFHNLPLFTTSLFIPYLLFLLKEKEFILAHSIDYPELFQCCAVQKNCQEKILYRLRARAEDSQKGWIIREFF